MAQSVEDRLAFLESKIAEYEAERAQMRELAGLRTDVKELHSSQSELRDDLRMRIHATGAEIRDEIDTQADALRTEYHAGYTYLGVKIDDVEDHVMARFDASDKEHKAAIADLAGEVRGLAAGQQHIIDMLSGGKPKRND